MSCEKVQEMISRLADLPARAGRRDNVMAHMQICKTCGAHWESFQSQRAELRSLDGAPVPEALHRNLREAAANYRVRRIAESAALKPAGRWARRLQLNFQHMMRPTFLPFAGGVVSAALAFTLLVPFLSFAHRFGGGPSTQIFNMPDGVVVGATGEPPRIEPADANSSDYQTVLELTVDNSGRVTDYEVTRGRLTPDLEELIMFSNFTPATFFGRRTTAKVRICYGKISPGSRMRS